MQKILDKVELVKVSTLGGSPAKIRIYPNNTATLFVAQDIWQELPVESRLFVILHELGHFVLKTGDEVKVDRWAFKQYVKTGRSLKKAVHALSRVLKHHNPDHSDRIKRQFYRAKHSHFLKTGNFKIFNNHKI